MTAELQPLELFTIPRTIHEPVRLGIMVLLYQRRNDGGLPFLELRQLLNATDGNLSRHLQKLANDGLIRIEKSRVNVPHTHAYLTGRGMLMLVAYAGIMVDLLKPITHERNGA